MFGYNMDFFQPTLNHHSFHLKNPRDTGGGVHNTMDSILASFPRNFLFMLLSFIDGTAYSSDLMMSIESIQYLLAAKLQ